jgi:hypothetical protein
MAPVKGLVGFVSSVKNFQMWEIVYGLSNDVVSSTASVTSNGRMFIKD